jgi:CRP-like cAMP-binding protein
MDIRDLADCNQKLDDLKKTVVRRRINPQKCRMKSLSTEMDDMELSEDEWDLITNAQGEAISFAKGDVILEEGSRNEAVWHIISGRVSVEKRLNDDQILTMAILGQGEVFGEVSFLAGSQSTASVVAQDALQAYATTKAVLYKLYRTDPSLIVKFYHYMCTVMAQRLIEETRPKEVPRRQMPSTSMVTRRSSNQHVLRSPRV